MTTGPATPSIARLALEVKIEALPLTATRSVAGGCNAAKVNYRRAYIVVGWVL